MKTLTQEELDYIAGLPDLSEMQRLDMARFRAIETDEEWQQLVRHNGLVTAARGVLESEGYMVTPPYPDTLQAVLQAERLLLREGFGIVDPQAAKRWSLAWLIGWRVWLEVIAGPLAARGWRWHWNVPHRDGLTRYADLRWWRLSVSFSARRWDCCPWQPHSLAPLMTQSLLVLWGRWRVVSL